MSSPRSALLIEVPEAERLVGDWRAAHDPTASQGVPCHITILYPFLAPEALDAAERGNLRRIIGTLPEAEFALTSVEQFPGLLWLRPAPADGLVALTRSLWAAYPQCPPYGGQFPDIQPHLTVAVTPDPKEQQVLAPRLRESLEGLLPLRCRATAISLFTSDADGRWTRRDRFPLDAGGSAGRATGSPGGIAR